MFVTWKCKECDAVWVGDETDAWCDDCDGDSIESLDVNLEEVNTDV